MVYTKKNITKITLNEETAYIIGVIVGDGHISASYKSKTKHYKDYRIVIDISDIEYMRYIERTIKKIIPTKTQLTNPKDKGNRIKRKRLTFRNKEFYLFITEISKVPSGKKSYKITVPENIKRSNIEIQKNFLAGYFDTDGGIRGKTLGFTTASKKMQIDTSEILSRLHIEHTTEKWLNKKYSREYYGIKIRKKEIDNFLNILPLRNDEKKKRISQKF